MLELNLSEKAKAREFIKDRQPSLYAFFISNFAYMRLRIGLFPDPTSYLQPFLVFVYMEVYYTQSYFWGLYLSHQRRETCIYLID